MPPVRIPVNITPTGQMIAAQARSYDGQGYVYGGTAARPGDWDCSSFCSYVLGHDLGMGLPGGRWGGPGMPPSVHGPVVTSYVTWGGAAPVPAGQEQPGDLVLWPGQGPGGHMGIVQGPGEMTSALNPQLGTLTSPIQGYGPSNVYVFRRITGTGTTPPPSPGGSWGDLAGPLLAGLAIGGGAILLIIGLAGAAAVGLGWAVMRVVRSAGDGAA